MFRSLGLCKLQNPTDHIIDQLTLPTLTLLVAFEV